LEDAAYTRLLRSYYLRELPIPSDLAETTRLVRAVTRREKEAVTHVLNEFFELREDGFHNARADKEIQQYQAQASTNRRIARERTVARSVYEASTEGTPNLEPLTKNQEPGVNLKPKIKSNTKAGVAFAPPDWVPLEAWNGYKAMRKKLRKPMTGRAEKMLVSDLDSGAGSAYFHPRKTATAGTAATARASRPKTSPASSAAARLIQWATCEQAKEGSARYAEQNHRGQSTT
jgi:uncharacterized protein YdaU (DUF1376 family)